MDLTTILTIIGLLAMFLVFGAALTQDKKSEYMDGVEFPIPVNAASKIYAGAMVCSQGSDGNAVPGADTAGLIFEGIARELADNTGGADGAIKVLVRRKGVYRMKSSAALAQTDIGKKVYIVDDQTVGLVATTANDIFCGLIVDIISSTEAWIDIAPAVERGARDAHVANPAGGATVDAESRAAINSILTILENQGLMNLS